MLKLKHLAGLIFAFLLLSTTQSYCEKASPPLTGIHVVSCDVLQDVQTVNVPVITYNFVREGVILDTGQILKDQIIQDAEKPLTENLISPRASERHRFARYFNKAPSICSGYSLNGKAPPKHC